MSGALMFNVLLLVFFSACFVDAGLLQDLPDSDIMGAAIWPRMILGLLVVMLLVNIVNIIRRPGQARPISASLKLLAGVGLVAAMSFLLEPLGFVVTVFLFVFAYSRLLGRRGALQLTAISLAVTLILFFLFSKGLSVMLPRGYGMIRDFSLMLESI